MECCRSEGCRRWLRGPLIHLCSVYVLYYWGENMWQFAVGLYLVHFEEGILRLVAICGFVSAGSVLLFGGLLGNWVDKTPRLTAMKVAIFIQDAAVSSLSLIVFFVLKFEEGIKDTWAGGLWTLLVAVIIILFIIAQLFGMVFKISLERDWFVVVAGGNTTLLARINSVTRTLDQICMIVAPLVAGQIMTHVSLKMAALIIAGYSLTTVFIKYALILIIYKRVPGLARAKIGKIQSDDKTPEEVLLKTQKEDRHGSAEVSENKQQQQKETESLRKVKDRSNGDVERKAGVDSEKEKILAQDNQHSDNLPDANNSCAQALCKDLLVLCTGWRVYAKQTVTLAGIGLACLYMTVLGFHSVTIGYAYANGITESIVGILTASAGIAGIVGSVIYPMLKTKLGLEKTGIFGFWFEISCLTLPLISIWLPGSPFDPGYFRSGHLGAANGCSETATVPETNLYNVLGNITDSSKTGSATVSSVSVEPCVAPSTVTPSIVVFLIGVILSRIGLWVADLTVAQLMQEKVAETERGVVNGVQNSLNMLFEIVKYVLVIILPYVQTYGILVILSYGFVTTGGLLFLAFVWKNRREVLYCCHSNRMPTSEDDRKAALETTEL